MSPSSSSSTSSQVANAVSNAGLDTGVHTIFGAFPGPNDYPNADPVETKADMRTRVAAALGGTIPLERIFNEATWDVPAAGTYAVVSFSQPPATVSSGSLDDEITTFVEALDPDTRYWLCLNHECDQSGRTYTAPQQVLAFQHFAEVIYLKRISLKHKVMPILMSWSIDHPNGKGYKWYDYYPGDDYCDAVGFDAYFRPRGPKTAETVYGPAVAAAASVGKKLFICETSLGAMGAGGTGFTDVEWTQNVKAAVAYLTGKARGVMWFYTNKIDGDWRLTPHEDALATYKQAVVDSLI